MGGRTTSGNSNSLVSSAVLSRQLSLPAPAVSAQWTVADADASASPIPGTPPETVALVVTSKPPVVEMSHRKQLVVPVKTCVDVLSLPNSCGKLAALQNGLLTTAVGAIGGNS